MKTDQGKTFALSLSKYKENFILKGGLLISSMIGIVERTTIDMDTTVKGISMEENTILDIVKEIVEINVGDDILNSNWKKLNQLEKMMNTITFVFI